jgi:very-short-patch-repair endonuclease
MPSDLARRLRRDVTEAEKVLWRLLRNRALGGAKFRRQALMGRYIADFACLERKLIVEADGDQHAASKTDAVRTSWLESRGFRVLRFANRDILENLEGVAAVVLKALEDARPPLTHPSPSRCRGSLPLPPRSAGGRGLG